MQNSWATSNYQLSYIPPLMAYDVNNLHKMFIVNVYISVEIKLKPAPYFAHHLLPDCCPDLSTGRSCEAAGEERDGRPLRQLRHRLRRHGGRADFLVLMGVSAN